MISSAIVGIYNPLTFSVELFGTFPCLAAFLALGSTLASAASFKTASAAAGLLTLTAPAFFVFLTFVDPASTGFVGSTSSKSEGFLTFLEPASGVAFFGAAFLGACFYSAAGVAFFSTGTAFSTGAAFSAGVALALGGVISF